jgi:Fe-S oxidoreductase
VETIADYKEIVDEIKANGGEAFNRCYQCGLCDAVCPWNRLIDFSMRKIVRQATFGMTDIESEDIWRCTTCGSCPQQCPRDVGQIESGVSLRRLATEYGIFPNAVKPLRSVSASLSGAGNPLGEDRQTRADWAEGLSVKPFAEGMEILYFPGCYLSYDPRLKKVARATATILNQAGVDYGILGTKENCCGESIRKTGNEDLFKRLARENIKTFIENGVKKILVSSPTATIHLRTNIPNSWSASRWFTSPNLFSSCSMRAGLNSPRRATCSSPIMTHATWGGTMGFMTPPGRR